MNGMKDNTEILINFALSNHFKKWKPYLLRMLKLSRHKKYQNSIPHGTALQLSLLKTITEIEQTIAEQLSRGYTKRDSNVLFNNRIKRILKDIADGYAWRMLKFNRLLMRVLSQNNSPGNLDTSISKEDKVVEKIINDGAHVLMNDLTNILRIGDLTVFYPDGPPHIIELKNLVGRCGPTRNV